MRVGKVTTNIYIIICILELFAKIPVFQECKFTHFPSNNRQCSSPKYNKLSENGCHPRVSFTTTILSLTTKWGLWSEWLLNFWPASQSILQRAANTASQVIAMSLATTFKQLTTSFGLNYCTRHIDTLNLQHKTKITAGNST